MTEEPQRGFYKVRLRRGEGWDVKPNAEQLDGNTYELEPVDLRERGIYAGEWEMAPTTAALKDGSYPIESGPTWIASGDLEPVQPKRKSRIAWMGDTITTSYSEGEPPFPKVGSPYSEVEMAKSAFRAAPDCDRVEIRSAESSTIFKREDLFPPEERL